MRRAGFKAFLARRLSFLNRNERRRLYFAHRSGRVGRYHHGRRGSDYRHVDRHGIVTGGPHFLANTQGGTYEQEALRYLGNKSDLDGFVPIEQMDVTARGKALRIPMKESSSTAIAT
jgi:hypothetical protein